MSADTPPNARADTRPAAGTKDSQISMRLPADLKDRVETYARMTGRSKSYVAMAALGEYLDWRLPQIQDLEVAIAAADRGEFATESEVAAVFARYGVAAPDAEMAAAALDAEVAVAAKRRSTTQASAAVTPAKRKRA